MTPTMEIQKFSKTEERQARELLARVDLLLDEARNGRDSLHRTYVEIGLALDEVEKTKAWLTGFRSYDSYIKDHCEPKFGKSRTQLYGYRAVAKNLLPTIPKEQLVEMGISKAMTLSSFVKSGKKLSERVLAAANSPDVGVEEFRATVAAEQGVPDDKGKWFDLGGFFCSAEDRKEIEEIFELGKQVADIPVDCPEWFERKLIIQAMVRECRSTWEPLTNTESV
jgi:hypothetical protein